MARLQVVLFHTCGMECALRRDAVRELLPVPHLQRPPGLPRPVAGFFNLSGAAVPVVRLDVLFGLEGAELSPEAGLYRHLILVGDPVADLPTALLVDRVEDVVEISSPQVFPVHERGTLNGCVEAEIETGGRLIPLLSPQRILMAEERQALAELSRQAQNRLGTWAVTA
ncbi:chemotaxis protein CheW [Microvirga thermotolerans]|uniref:Chemotaxis protein CheW n=1 Tax=Microvirga thermotolerans TaxID=2651334 RepID=A0A5P9JV17_9HYPH|nr:chemotaxis protein CheW [Microvirga thermotolerans]QFU15290.1 chemotaxis protein CheW [Microvirga thermotolerans]